MKTIKTYNDFLNEEVHYWGRGRSNNEDLNNSLENLFDILKEHGDVDNIQYFSGGFVTFNFNGEEYTIFYEGDDEVKFLEKTYNINDMESIVDVIINEKNNKNVDLSIELEHLIRTKTDEELGDMDVDGFFDMFGVTTGKSDYAWASVLNGREKYKDMSDEEFDEIYKNYKNEND